MNLSEIMKKDFLTIDAEMDVLTLAKLLIEKGEDAALVVNQPGELIGIVTETDLIFQEKKLHIPTFFTFLDSFIFFENVSKFNEEVKKMAATMVKDIMTEEIITVGFNASVSDAATIMIEKRVHHLPVIENKKPVGVVTKEGLLRAFVAERQE